MKKKLKLKSETELVGPTKVETLEQIGRIFGDNYSQTQFSFDESPL